MRAPAAATAKAKTPQVVMTRKTTRQVAARVVAVDARSGVFYIIQHLREEVTVQGNRIKHSDQSETQKTRKTARHPEHHRHHSHMVQCCQ